MRILTGYLFRAHLGPFLFALTALESLLFLNAIAQRLQDLAGKGLGMDVILEFMKLSLPHTIALTLPMAVLVAVLYAFSDLAASNEITAMKAGGVRPQRLLMPLLGLGTIVSLLMFVFNDRVLPESNHQLKNLLMDVGRKTPTFNLREQAVNPINVQASGERVFLMAGRIDNQRSALYDVEIVNPTNPMDLQITVADSAQMYFNQAQTDLYLTLFDGVSYVSSEDPPGSYRQMRFKKQVVPLRGVGNELDRQMGGTSRSEREMNTDTLAANARRLRNQVEDVRAANLVLSYKAVRFALGYEVKGDEFVTPRALLGLGAPMGEAEAGFGENELAGAAGPVPLRDHRMRGLIGKTDQHLATISALERIAAGYRVEIHKKYSLAVACLVFVLIGAPVAVRFPRGGLGLVIAASSVIFGVYWVGLIGGENLAEAGRAPPWLGMWAANVVFGALGLVLVQRMGREAATMRGGGWDDLMFTVREGLAKPFRRRGVDRGVPAAAGD